MDQLEVFLFWNTGGGGEEFRRTRRQQSHSEATNKKNKTPSWINSISRPCSRLFAGRKQLTTNGTNTWYVSLGNSVPEKKGEKKNHLSLQIKWFLHLKPHIDVFNYEFIHWPVLKHVSSINLGMCLSAVSSKTCYSLCCCHHDDAERSDVRVRGGGGALSGRALWPEDKLAPERRRRRWRGGGANWFRTYSLFWNGIQVWICFQWKHKELRCSHSPRPVYRDTPLTSGWGCSTLGEDITGCKKLIVVEVLQ